MDEHREIKKKHERKTERTMSFRLFAVYLFSVLLVYCCYYCYYCHQRCIFILQMRIKMNSWKCLIHEFRRINMVDGIFPYNQVNQHDNKSFIFLTTLTFTMVSFKKKWMREKKNPKNAAKWLNGISCKMYCYLIFSKKKAYTHSNWLASMQVVV